MSKHSHWLATLLLVCALMTGAGAARAEVPLMADSVHSQMGHPAAGSIAHSEKQFAETPCGYNPPCANAPNMVQCVWETSPLLVKLLLLIGIPLTILYAIAEFQLHPDQDY